MKMQDPSTLLFADEVLNGEKFEIDETSFSAQEWQLWVGDSTE